MARKNYYDILCVTRDADEEALKRAFRELARQCHPDRNPGDSTAAKRFQEIHEAYSILTQPERRREHDLQLAETRLAADEGPAAFRDQSFSSSAPTNVDVTVSLPLRTALRGGHTHVEAPNGELVRVTVPRGCRDRTAVRVRGRGQPTAAGPGDLVVMFRVQPDPEFRREGNHLHLILEISAVEAMVGATRSITTPYGRTIKLTIPAGAQPGERIRLPRQGVSTCREVGDLFIEVDVRVPKELTEEQRARLRTAAQSLGLL
jgi:curved DNA-binding protein